MAKKAKTVVLVVDDNKPHCYVLARMLENAGYSAIQAHTGQDALKLATKKPALILLDINLPDFGGLEVAGRLHSNPSTASIPVVFMSASNLGAPAQIHDAQVRASGFLTQPVEQSHLVAVVEGTLSRNAATPSNKNNKNKSKRRK